MKKINICKNCNKEFSFYLNSTKNRGSFCSRKCQADYAKKNSGSIRECPICKKKFYAKGNPKKRFCCSRKCGAEYRKTGRIIKCDYCNEEVYKQNIYLNKNKNNFCSVKCAISYQRRNRLKFTCKICNNEFSWSKSRIKENNPTYCSLECRNKDPLRKQMLINMNILQQNLKINNLEKKGYKIIKSLNLDFKPQFLIGNKFIVDAFISKYNLIVQFDGDYWHGNPVKYKILSDRQKRRKIIDKSQNAYFKKCGFNLLRVWESKINNLKEKLEIIIDKIKKSNI